MENWQKIKSTVTGILTAVTGILVMWKPEIFGGEEWPAIVTWIGTGITLIASWVQVWKSNW